MFTWTVCCLLYLTAGVGGNKMLCCYSQWSVFQCECKIQFTQRAKFYVYTLSEGHCLNLGLCTLWLCIHGEVFTYTNKKHICRGQSQNLTCMVKLQLLCCCLFWAVLVSLYSRETVVPFWLLLSLCSLLFFSFVFLSCHLSFLIFPSLWQLHFSEPARLYHQLVLQLWQGKDFSIFLLPGCL